MGLSQADLSAQLTAIQAAITAILANPNVYQRWRVGQVEMDNRQYLQYLREMQESVIKLMRSEPSESYDTVQNAIGPFGHDATEYVDENF